MALAAGVWLLDPIKSWQSTKSPLVRSTAGLLLVFYLPPNYQNPKIKMLPSTYFLINISVQEQIFAVGRLCHKMFFPTKFLLVLMVRLQFILDSEIRVQDLELDLGTDIRSFCWFWYHRVAKCITFCACLRIGWLFDRHWWTRPQVCHSHISPLLCSFSSVVFVFV